LRNLAFSQKEETIEQLAYIRRSQLDRSSRSRRSATGREPPQKGRPRLGGQFGRRAETASGRRCATGQLYPWPACRGRCRCYRSLWGSLWTGPPGRRCLAPQCKRRRSSML